MSIAEHKYNIGVRRFGLINWIGFYTLYFKEVQRFLIVWIQTIVSPIVTMLLFLTVFSLAIGSDRSDVLGYKFTTFLGSALAASFLIGLATTLTRSSMIGFWDVLPVFILMAIAILMMVYEAFFDKK